MCIWIGRKTVRGQNPSDPNRPTTSVKNGTNIAMTAAAADFDT